MGAARLGRTRGRAATIEHCRSGPGTSISRFPKLRRQTFETAIIERYRRREGSVEGALIEMYLAGNSVQRVEDITEALWVTRVRPSTVSNLNKKNLCKIEACRIAGSKGSVRTSISIHRDEAQLGRRSPQCVAAVGLGGRR